MPTTATDQAEYGWTGHGPKETPTAYPGLILSPFPTIKLWFRVLCWSEVSTNTTRIDHFFSLLFSRGFVLRVWTRVKGEAERWSLSCMEFIHFQWRLCCPFLNPPPEENTHRSYQTAMGISHTHRWLTLPHTLCGHLNSPWPHANWNPSIIVKSKMDLGRAVQSSSLFLLLPLRRKKCLCWWVTVVQVRRYHQGKWIPSPNCLELWVRCRGPRRDSELGPNDRLILGWIVRNHTLLSELRNEDYFYWSLYRITYAAIHV